MPVTIDRVFRSSNPNAPLTRGEVITILRESYLISSAGGPVGHAEQHIDDGAEGSFLGGRDDPYLDRESHSAFKSEDDAVSALYMILLSSAGRYGIRRLQRGQWTNIGVHIKTHGAIAMTTSSWQGIMGLIRYEDDCRAATGVLRLDGQRLHVQTLFPRNNDKVLTKWGATVDNIVEEGRQMVAAYNGTTRVMAT